MSTTGLIALGVLAAIGIFIFWRVMRLGRLDAERAAARAEAEARERMGEAGATVPKDVDRTVDDLRRGGDL